MTCSPSNPPTPRIDSDIFAFDYSCRCAECLDQDSNYGRSRFTGQMLDGSGPVYPMYLALENDDGVGGAISH